MATLSPVSRAIVEVSDLIVGIGGGQVGADEMFAAHLSGRKVLFYPAYSKSHSSDPKGVAHKVLSTVMTVRSYVCSVSKDEISWEE